MAANICGRWRTVCPAPANENFPITGSGQTQNIPVLRWITVIVNLAHYQAAIAASCRASQCRKRAA
ncbi:hypothetical protein F2088_03320 [Salmonella enterica]|uniref:Uncharacterized protein n=1 Tax=Salmonella enterica TaxID=28901 RepID=A0A5Z4V0K5_SALER|nr:hypothetical protein [Salmonella enterica]EDC9113319.1 hypothetical protein [Salmonella enterica subsp. enterica serovar Newport]EAX2051270.1 hypothetical protein [Salmonella enterica]EAX6839960.1 hypothetical protein [Salmonella enterica]EAX6980578.1 hypothetical protein [Salmonella enterica]